MKNISRFKEYINEVIYKFIILIQASKIINKDIFLLRVKNFVVKSHPNIHIIAKYNSSIGAKQKGKLRDAITEAFKDKKPGEYPDFKEIESKLLDIYEGKSDSLTEIIGSLCRYNVFKEDKKIPNFLNENLYFSLSGDLPNDLRFTSLFLIITYIYNVFMNMENAPVNDKICAMRYVILIDEAHVVFKEKKYHDILEKIY